MAEKKQEQERYTREEIPANYKVILRDNETGIEYEDLMEILREILNKVDKIKRSVA